MQNMTKYSITDAYTCLKSLRPVLEKKNGSAAKRNIWTKRFIITATLTAA